MVEMVYCQWVKETVTASEIPASCKPYVADGICNRCEPSPQLELGMKPSELLRNIREQ